MNFNKKPNRLEKIGEKGGYLFGFFLFTTVLYFALILLNKLPESWSYFHIMGVTIPLSLAGKAIKKLLK